MKRLTVGIILSLGLASLLGACAETDTLEEKPGVVRVEAPDGKCWSGQIGDSTKEGCGSNSFDIEGEAIIVALAQKETEGDWALTLVLEMDGKQVDDATTSAEYGIAEVSE